MIGVMGATSEEISLLVGHLSSSEKHRIAGREFHVGSLDGCDVVVAFSRWGKVAAATTASLLINHFKVEKLIFSGVAGGVGSAVQLGDIVIPSHVIQHDLDGRPFFDKFQIPLTDIIQLACDPILVEGLTAAAQQSSIGQVVHAGVVGTGDQFVGSSEKVAELRNEIPSLQALEMEGAAVGQVAHDFGVPFAVVRVISDLADEKAPQDFDQFLRNVAGPACYEIVSCFIRMRSSMVKAS